VLHIASGRASLVDREDVWRLVAGHH